MINFIENYSKFFFYSFPILLISGPLLTDLGISIFCIFFLVYIFKTQNTKIFKNKYFLIFLTFYFYISVNSLFSKNLDSITNAIFYFRFGIFSLGIFFFIKKKIIKLEDFFKIILFLLLLIFIDSLFQQIFSYNLIGLKQFHPARISSFFGDELVLGSYAFRIFSLILPLIIFLKLKKERIWLICSSVLIMTIILLSGERLALFLYMTLLFYLFLYFPTSLKNKIISLIFVIFFFSTFLYFNKFQYKRIIENTIINNLSEVRSKNLIFFSQMHNDHIITAIKIFKSNVLFGSGVKMYRYKCNDKAFFTGKWGCSTHPHQTVAQILAETGLIGIVFLLTFYYYIFKKIIINHYNKNFNKQLLAQNLIFLIAFLNIFPLLPSGNFFNNWLSAIYFLPICFFEYINNQK